MVFIVSFCVFIEQINVKIFSNFYHIKTTYMVTFRFERFKFKLPSISFHIPLLKWTHCSICLQHQRQENRNLDIEMCIGNENVHVSYEAHFYYTELNVIIKSLRKDCVRKITFPLLTHFHLLSMCICNFLSWILIQR